jgi:hypothetical protein
MYCTHMNVQSFVQNRSFPNRESVGNKRVGSVTNVELRKSDNKYYYNDAQSESPDKCGMKREDETLTTGIMYLPRVLPNGTQGQVLSY